MFGEIRTYRFSSQYHSINTFFVSALPTSVHQIQAAGYLGILARGETKVKQFATKESGISKDGSAEYFKFFCIWQIF